MVSHINTEVPVPRSSPVVRWSEVDVMDVGCQGMDSYEVAEVFPSHLCDILLVIIYYVKGQFCSLIGSSACQGQG